jgi:hypothetical protein
VGRQRIDRSETSPDLDQPLRFAFPTTDEDDVPATDRTERIEGPRDLALDVKGAGERGGQLRLKRKREIGHGREYTQA